MIEVWTDGACLPNPGAGGWAWIRRDGVFEVGSENPTTNQRMEMMAVLSAIRALANQGVMRIYSDSQYVIKGVTQWSPKWIRNGWRNSTGRPVANKDLWEAILLAVNTSPGVEFQWVRGHSGDEMNEKADQLAHNATGLEQTKIEHWRSFYHGGNHATA